MANDYHRTFTREDIDDVAGIVIGYLMALERIAHWKSGYTLLKDPNPDKWPLLKYSGPPRCHLPQESYILNKPDITTKIHVYPEKCGQGFVYCVNHHFYRQDGTRIPELPFVSECNARRFSTKHAATKAAEQKRDAISQRILGGELIYPEIVYGE